jgi:hypothetical protein
MPYRGRACCKSLLRNFGGNAFGVSTDTGTPSSFSAPILKAASVRRLVASAGSTSKSRSLRSVSVPFKTDPKTRGAPSRGGLQAAATRRDVPRGRRMVSSRHCSTHGVGTSAPVDHDGGYVPGPRKTCGGFARLIPSVAKVDPKRSPQRLPSSCLTMPVSSPAWLFRSMAVRLRVFRRTKQPASGLRACP